MRKFISPVNPELRNLRRLARSLGIESEAPAVIERERMMFGLIKDISQLEKAALKEHQEQYEIKIPKTDKNALAGKLRVRRSQEVGKEEFNFTFTVKTELSGDENSTEDEKRSLEINEPTTEQMFMAFQYIAEGGMKKTRYEFPIEGTDLKWEFDVFAGSDGQPQAWCKIDLEVPQGGLVDQPPFPIEMERIISSNPAAQSEEEKTILDTLFTTVFKFTNPHLK